MAWAGTTAVRLVAEPTAKLEAGLVPNSTCVTLLRLVPATVTVLPGRPLAGENPLMVGAWLQARGLPRSSTSSPTQRAAR